MNQTTSLTPKQTKVLNFIQDKVAKNIPPTIREIASFMGFSSTGTVRDYLKALKAKGFIKIHPRKSRSIELLRKQTFGIPILGKVAAGRPDLAVEYMDDYFSFDKLVKEEGIFMLRVKGDSMIDAGFLEGDLAMVKRQSLAQDKDIVVALIADEATVKRFIKINNKLYLEPANKNYKLIEITKETKIIGKVVGLVRKYV
jgi:repressor LexA